MAEQAAKDDAARKRIICHMNDDHHDSIVRYLQHYCGLSSWTAYNGSMTNIDLNNMTFSCHGETHRIPLKPPMTSYRDARERAVEMDKESLQALKKSDITVKDFVPPTGIYGLEFLIIATTFLAYSQRWWFARGAIVERILGSRFAEFSWTIQPWLVPAMIVIHGAELVYFIRNHLWKHSVNVRTLLWWQWVGTTFIEGQFAFRRFNQLVAKKREEKQRQKH